jgi:hypothetical protein
MLDIESPPDIVNSRINRTNVMDDEVFVAVSPRAALLAAQKERRVVTVTADEVEPFTYRKIAEFHGHSPLICPM